MDTLEVPGYPPPPPPKRLSKPKITLKIPSPVPPTPKVPTTPSAIYWGPTATKYYGKAPQTPASLRSDPHTNPYFNPFMHMYQNKASDFMFKQFEGFKDFTMNTAKSGLSMGEKTAFWFYNKLKILSKKWFTHFFLTICLVLYSVMGAAMFMALEVPGTIDITYALRHRLEYDHRKAMVHASHIICHPCWQRADRAARHFSSASTSTGTSTSRSQLRCANCGINIMRMRRHILNDEHILSLICQQAAPRVVTATDYICDACHSIFNEREITSASQESTPSVGHQNICIQCGRSLAQVRSHAVDNSDRVCHRCYQRTQVSGGAILDPPDTVSQPDPQQAERITLPNYTRAPDTHARCIFPECNSTSQQMIPFLIRVRLFSDHKYYIPPNCRICRSHLERQSWSELFQVENVLNSFSATYIEDFCELLKNDKITLDFDQIEQMDDHLVWYWLGRTKQQFGELLAELPGFQNRNKAVGAYLMKLRTGDSDERIATLLNIGRTSLHRLLSNARANMVEHFVPQHLGLNHLSRRDVAERNLYIPNSLFGNPGSNIEDRKAIAIMDGTYIYVQKSSNYLYQKKTYSLHKYRNLVKPFLIVCCDGYIIDVLGPFPATKSDADILNEEFSDPQKPLRQYFREGDVFILDRGFRDSIPLLQRLNYSVHYPLSLQQGESQMSTQNANESRKVTLCRWVVEVVNGRFKRDYKLLRQEFFNRATKHLMQDFTVAAALINRFHPVLVDREDAQDIVSIIQEKIFTDNTLADFVDRHSLNRRRAQFSNIIVERDTLTDFPRMELNELILIPLGIYQIKQARSYYGEHVREDGSYIIEVCREVDEELINELELLDNSNTWLLRGKIQSRHISHKKYFVYILVDNNQTGRNAIKQHYCNCIAGRRTVGCCAHVMTIIWYLSWARHQENINPPAQFLDDILFENRDHY